MQTDPLVKRLNRHDWEVIAELKKAVEANPVEGHLVILDVLRAEALRDDAVIVVQLLRVLAEHYGLEAFEAQIVDNWDRMDDIERRRIIAAFHEPSFLSCELAITLFHAASSRVVDRHQILAGLAVTAKSRGCQRLVLDLIDKVGTYNDEMHRATLEGFKSAVLESFGAKTEAYEKG